MIHAVTIVAGQATFCSRFVQTNKYTTERDLGYPVYPNMFGAFTSEITASLFLTAARILTGQFDPFVNGIGTANTSLALIAGKLFALVETDVPYKIRVTEDGDVATVGRRQFDSAEGFQIMTAHPKSDPDTGETFAFRYFAAPPFLKLFRIDSDGRKHNSVPIFSLKSSSFIHDFAVTKIFAVFPDTQIVIEPLEILRDSPSSSDAAPRMRPMGQKRAKRQAKQKAKMTSTVNEDKWKHLQEAMTKQMSVQEVQLKLQHIEFCRQDTSGMSEDELYNHFKLVAEINAKYGWK
ncbi:probable carotenoid cleavage dioxygenase 4, chloroplastic [Salvia miltiorrhiza]|uniref:probable carotenoid cleavage dioxygenase 4, chloroplastic n=1 Tax=Salvia miltiorrhiza TaxID=226208 RepID=UPI0025AC414C|nr:probable carotenoid cleavage dioxygenase 4, chloroplastic [Salvia miltiorrhiza]